MTYYETKIGKIIEEEFDSRMGNAVISYIMDKGIENGIKIVHLSEFLLSDSF